jgi:transcriptional regulator with XRE-family HTH domain
LNDLYEQLKTDLADEESRYAYADSVTNAFLTAQIDALKKERNLTQEQVAKLVGTKQSAISRWQNSGYSSCKLETLRKFARAYGVRLRVSFEEFGSLPPDIGGFTKERLAPRKFEDDPAFKETHDGQSQAMGGIGLKALAQGEFASLGGVIGSHDSGEHTLQQLIGIQTKIPNSTAPSSQMFLTQQMPENVVPIDSWRSVNNTLVRKEALSTGILGGLINKGVR